MTLTRVALRDLPDSPQRVDCAGGTVFNWMNHVDAFDGLPDSNREPDADPVTILLVWVPVNVTSGVADGQIGATGEPARSVRLCAADSRIKRCRAWAAKRNQVHVDEITGGTATETVSSAEWAEMLKQTAENQ